MSTETKCNGNEKKKKLFLDKKNKNLIPGQKQYKNL